MERRSRRLRRSRRRPRAGGPPGRNGRGGDRGDGRSGGRGDGRDGSRGAGIPEPEHSRGQLVAALLIMPLAILSMPFLFLLIAILSGHGPD